MHGVEKGEWELNQGKLDLLVKRKRKGEWKSS
jgi:hypothetical protein